MFASFNFHRLSTPIKIKYNSMLLLFNVEIFRVLIFVAEDQVQNFFTMKISLSMVVYGFF